jgi:hypothetical protein
MPRFFKQISFHFQENWAGFQTFGNFFFIFGSLIVHTTWVSKVVFTNWLPQVQFFLIIKMTRKGKNNKE